MSERILTVPVDATVPDPAPSDADREAVRSRLLHLFRRAGSEATAQTLLRVMIEYREERQP